ncbi:MAG: hypothetical protein H6839_08540 [Planctomycetes bacterium]|nr:hypothetical protein [Planctomycetota bacterium]
MKRRVEVVKQRPLSTDEQWQRHVRKKLRRRIVFTVAKLTLVPAVVLVLLAVAAIPLAVG